MKKHMCIALVCLCAALALVGCAKKKPAGETAAPEKIVFKLSHVFTPQQPTHLALLDVAKKINERSGGVIEIQIFPNEEIAVGQDGIEQCLRGAYFINVYDPSCMASWIPDYSALIGPMLYQNGAEYSAMCQTDFAKSLNKKAEDTGLKVLALDYNFGMRSIVMAKKQLSSIDDFQGVKIRVVRSPLWIDTFTAFGASPVGLPWGEVYNAMQSGVVNAYESSISDTRDNQMQEVAKYFTKTAHFIGTGAVVLSKTVWDSLSPEFQKIMQEEFTAGAIVNNKMTDEEEAVAQTQLEALGMVFNEIDLTPFRERSRAVFDKMQGVTPGIYDVLNAEITKIRAK